MRNFPIVKCQQQTQALNTRHEGHLAWLWSSGPEPLHSFAAWPIETQIPSVKPLAPGPRVTKTWQAWILGT